MQISFQQGAVDTFGPMEEEILPESHIDRSLNTEGAIAYAAMVDNQLVGGAIVVINDKTKHNHLDFLFIKQGEQGKEIGQLIWKHIELLHPDTKVWETCTPYFEKRNIHFYVNKCGFHIVEYFNKFHIDPNDPDIGKEDSTANDYFDGMFKFEKTYK